MTGLPAPLRSLLRWVVFLLAVIALGLMLGYGIAKAQHAGHAENHDWYQHLKTPHGYSCCNGDTAGKRGDCRPVQSRPAEDGGWEAYFGGRWQPVPVERILPDHLNRVPLRSHICEQDGYVRCFLKGGAAG